eukprot:jgi/Picre1/32967/NNA_008294.t1
MASMDAHYKKKMSQMNDGYRDVKSVMERLRKERDELEQDVKELREKYGQKAKEAHNLRQSMGSSRHQGATGLVLMDHRGNILNGIHLHILVPGKGFQHPPAMELLLQAVCMGISIWV